MPPGLAWCPNVPVPAARSRFLPPTLRPPRRRPRRAHYAPAVPAALQLDVGADPPAPRGVLTDSDLGTKWKQAGGPGSGGGAREDDRIADDASTADNWAAIGETDADNDADDGPTLSVLETKWKNDAARAARAASAARGAPPAPPAPRRDRPRRPPASSYRPPPDDPTASDPYEAFARFTRLAAPTAALGASPAPASKASTTAAATSPTEWAAAASLAEQNAPYSAGAITHRLLKYQRSRTNLDLLISLFTGEFDNYPQVAAERRAGLTPGDGGGHEHIHCSVDHVAPGLLYARYYFDGDPARVFRSRLYALRPCDDCERGLVEMRIFRFYEQTLRQLRDASYRIDAVDWADDDVYDWLRGCEVFWERYDPPASNGAAVPDNGNGAGNDNGAPDADDPARALGIHPGTRFVGYMDGGGCECFSPEIDARIRVMDDLLLTANELWVADRGFDDSDNFVYGNRRGVPYKMTRVTETGPLAWTLSPDAAPPPEDAA